MENQYNPKLIEAKWQEKWEAEGIYHAQGPEANKQKFYGLIEFPYPSGEGLHVGHPRSYTAIDIMTRKKRMEGKNVLYPIGWDAFGLPTENFAIKNKIKPQDATAKNIATFKRQLKSLGLGFDWSREINTTDPAYYRWTQWMFLKFFNSYFDEIEGRAKSIDQLAIPDAIKSNGEKAIEEHIDMRRMAYKAQSSINWCPSCKIGLANEEAQGGVCERCGAVVEEKLKEQWMLRITKYAERLIKDLDTVDYLDRIKTQQINWIGKSHGAYIDFRIKSETSGLLPNTVKVFTTRPDTLFGATYLVLSPEHPLIEAWLAKGLIANAEEMMDYKKKSKVKSELERQENKEKTGVELKGVLALNPSNNQEVQVWVADYVLASYGTGAIMAVPAHDGRDYEFAKKFNLQVVQVVAAAPGGEIKGLPFTDEGVSFNSGILNGFTTKEAKEKMIEWLEQNGVGQAMTTYKLRDWVFSRQRYWGEPIPIINCQNCGYVSVPEADLPIVLPEVEKYEPTENGESPLAAIRSWVEVKCPKCGGSAERETDTMPNWAGSSWYFLRYCDSKNENAFADSEKLKYWMPVDLYNGGMEHTTLHLLYSRFWYKFLWDIGVIPKECGSEPYCKRRSHALILGEGGIKMSKSKGNVVNPDEIVEKYGADVFRMYEMFIGPFDADAPWDTNGIEGVKRFLEKVWRFFSVIPAKAGIQDQGMDSRFPDVTVGTGHGNDKQNGFETLFNQTIKKVGDDIETMNFNTAVSAMMILMNGLSEVKELPSATVESFLKILAPFAPHIAEELWHNIGHETSIHIEPWPVYDASKLQAETFELVVQINGKVRDRMVVESSISEEDAKAKALSSDKIKAYLEGKEPLKIVYVQGRLISISI
ncbi:MAG: class I tRNA ligase family protein [Patescibacteria group bacterium]